MLLRKLFALREPDLHARPDLGTQRQSPYDHDHCLDVSLRSPGALYAKTCVFENALSVEAAVSFFDEIDVADPFCGHSLSGVNPNSPLLPLQRKR